jgi:hypothetical protein
MERFAPTRKFGVKGSGARVDLLDVSDSTYTRLTHLAVFAVVNLAAILIGLALPGAVAVAVVLLASLAIYIAIGPFQADVALNESLDEDERRRWRIALYLVPWAVALYWHRYVRRV